ncbi:inositol monophosphatase family protein [Humidisolicoccus flavus]|uniref:inositol monophosphatase family protein n=1 Tax=Humidisolicoccus flavus TaxID=3111414 RepID=UPI0032523BC0
MHDYSEDLDLALRLADAAAEVAMQRFSAVDLEISTKPDKSHVTDADLAVERAIRAILQEERPDDSILGEEYGTEGESTRQWIIDPIDGTAQFLRGTPLWTTLIALAVDGKIVAGVCSAPALGKRWWASLGAGAWTDPEAPRRIAVSSVATLDDAAFAYNSIKGWDRVGRLDDLIALQKEVWVARSVGDAWSYMMVAEGQIDALAEFDLKPYDLAPHDIIVREAGGSFTAVDGSEGPWHGSALVTNGVLHSTFLQRLNGDRTQGVNE